MPILADYVWDTPLGFRWKTRVFHNVNDLQKDEKGVFKFPEWDYDGSSTGQAEPDKRDGCTEIKLNPIYVCYDPMRPGYTHPIPGDDFCRGYIVLCDIVHTNDDPVEGWHRQWANKIMKEAKYLKPWFGIEQEYYLFDPRTKTPAGFSDNKYIRPQGPYYCRMGEMNGRNISEKHMEMCLSAGLKVSGTNAEVGPSQWEYQIGPCEGIEAADQLMVSRYLLDRISESAGLAVSRNPKPILGNWNGSGCHVNYSTIRTRENLDKADAASSNYDTYDAILETVKRLEKTHEKMLKTYSDDNKNRLVGGLEAPKYEDFSWGIGTRDTSVRIPTRVAKSGYGYIEDRRPGSDMDPYITLGTIVESDLKNNFLDEN